MAILYFIIAALLQAFFIGWMYEVKIQKSDKKTGIFGGKWCEAIFNLCPGFWTWFLEPKIMRGFIFLGSHPMHYRWFMGITKLVMIGFMIYFGSWYSLGAVVIAQYLGLQQSVSNNFLGRDDDFKTYTQPQFLKQKYQIGYWLYRPYTFTKFQWCEVIAGALVCLAVIIEFNNFISEL